MHHFFGDDAPVPHPWSSNRREVVVHLNLDHGWGTDENGEVGSAVAPLLI